MLWVMASFGMVVDSVDPTPLPELRAADPAGDERCACDDGQPGS